MSTITVFLLIWAVVALLVFFGLGFFTRVLYVDPVLLVLRTTGPGELGFLLAVAGLWPLILAVAILAGLILILPRIRWPQSRPKGATTITTRPRKA